MITIPDAARLVGRSPGTIRRWIREGRLPSRRIGSRSFVEDADLLAPMRNGTVALPPAWRRTATGESMPDVVGAVRASRR